jgi:Mn2+/Fe2+ NRAMP family transporter
MSLRLRDCLGPSIIIAAAVVGTGELIVAPRLGATVGLSALWIVILGCMVKVLLQEELGRHTILTGDTTLEALDRVPGPRWRLSWAGWALPLLIIAGNIQMGGILVSMVQTMGLFGIPGHTLLLATLVSAGTALLLVFGRYGFIESTSGILVAGFTVLTLLALVFLQRTEDAVSVAALMEGLKFKLPEKGLADAIAVFGITGIGTSELVFYPYWCLEKGYAKDLKAGIIEDPSLIKRRILGMRIDISAAVLIYTFSTLAFFILGAAILHGRQDIPKGLDMIETLSQMYTKTFGQWVFVIFLIGALVVLFSTFLVAMATWARLIADIGRRFAPSQKTFNHRTVVNWSIGILATVYVLMVIGFNETPQWLIVGGAVVQTILLPVFAIAILLIRRKRAPEYRPGKAFNAALYLSVALIVVAAVFALSRMFVT